MPNPLHLELSEPHLTRVRVALARHRDELAKLTKSAMDRGVGAQEAYAAIAVIEEVLSQLVDQPELPFPADRTLHVVDGAAGNGDFGDEPEFEAEDA